MDYLKIQVNSAILYQTMGAGWWRNTHIFHKILGKSDFVLAPGQPVSIKTESDETAKWFEVVFILEWSFAYDEKAVY